MFWEDSNLKTLRHAFLQRLMEQEPNQKYYHTVRKVREALDSLHIEDCIYWVSLPVPALTHLRSTDEAPTFGVDLSAVQCMSRLCISAVSARDRLQMLLRIRHYDLSCTLWRSEPERSVPGNAFYREHDTAKNKTAQTIQTHFRCTMRKRSDVRYECWLRKHHCRRGFLVVQIGAFCYCSYILCLSGLFHDPLKKGKAFWSLLVLV